MKTCKTCKKEFDEPYVNCTPCRKKHADYKREWQGKNKPPSYFKAREEARLRKINRPKKTCPQCNKTFTDTSNTNNKIYCNRTCFQEVQYKRKRDERAGKKILKNCVVCDAEFMRYSKKHVCCSRECTLIRSKLLRRELHGKDWTKTCVVCGITYQNMAHNSRTCSKSCKLEDRKNQRKKTPSTIQPAIKRTCACGKEFEAVGLARTRVSCSKECADKRRKEQIKEHHHTNKVLIVKTCDFCPTTFNPRAGQRICLSDECKKKLKREYSKKYYKTPTVEQMRAYRNKHRDRINEYFREYNAKRRKIPKHAVNGRMYAAIRKVIKKGKMGVSTTKTLNDLYTEEEIMSHFESYFTEENGYTWDNMSEWHIDHIRPVASFNFTSTDCEDFKKCWALNNLQPLWAADNMRKSDKWDGIVNA